MRFDARLDVEKVLKSLDLYRGKEENPMRIGVCSKTGDIIEPMIKPQWYLNCKNAAEMAIHAVRNGDIQIKPKHYEKVWFDWLENIQDWCLSRQLWWGHRIPAYKSNTSDDWVVTRNPELLKNHSE